MSSRTKLDLYSPSHRWLRYLLGYLSLLLVSILSKVKIKGRHHIPETGPYIVAINHFSLVDPAFVVSALQRPIIFLAASDQTIPWYYGWAAWLYGFIPTNRTRLGPSTIKRAKKVLQQKEILGIFPEGTSTDSVLRKAKKGVVYLATLRNYAILPVGICGLENVWSDWLKGVRPLVKIEIGKIFYPEAKETENHNRDQKMDIIGETVMCRIAALLPETAHGAFTNNKRISQFIKENNE